MLREIGIKCRGSVRCVNMMVSPRLNVSEHLLISLAQYSVFLKERKKRTANLQ